jgi:hypothetical protein
MSDSKSENREKVSTLTAGELISASLTPEGTDEEILAFVFDTIDKGFQISIPQKITPGQWFISQLPCNQKMALQSLKNLLLKSAGAKKTCLSEGLMLGLKF